MKGVERYLETKSIRRAVCQASAETERNRFRDLLQREDHKCDVFNIAKKKVKTNQDIIGDQYVRNDDNVLAVSGEDKKIDNLEKLS